MSGKRQEAEIWRKGKGSLGEVEKGGGGSRIPKIAGSRGNTNNYTLHSIL